MFRCSRDEVFSIKLSFFCSGFHRTSDIVSSVGQFIGLLIIVWRCLVKLVMFGSIICHAFYVLYCHSIPDRKLWQVWSMAMVSLLLFFLRLIRCMFQLYDDDLEQIAGIDYLFFSLINYRFCWCYDPLEEGKYCLCSMGLPINHCYN